MEEHEELAKLLELISPILVQCMFVILCVKDEILRQPFTGRSGGEQKRGAISSQLSSSSGTERKTGFNFTRRLTRNSRLNTSNQGNPSIQVYRLLPKFDYKIPTSL
jgi:hypothetical protein